MLERNQLYTSFVPQFTSAIFNDNRNLETCTV